MSPVYVYTFSPVQNGYYVPGCASANYTSTYSTASPVCPPTSDHALYQGRASSISGNTATMVLKKCDGSAQSSGRTYWIAVGDSEYPNDTDVPIYITRTSGIWDGGTTKNVSGINIWPDQVGLDSAVCGASKYLFVITDGSTTPGVKTWYQYRAVTFTKSCD